MTGHHSGYYSVITKAFTCSRRLLVLLRLHLIIISYRMELRYLGMRFHIFLLFLFSVASTPILVLHTFFNGALCLLATTICLICCLPLSPLPQPETIHCPVIVDKGSRYLDANRWS